MISARGVSLQFGKRVLFSGVNVTFTKGNCYGLIGANGSGKSTFLRILSGEMEATRGDVEVTRGERLSVLKQDHFAFDEYSALTTVMMGDKRLYDVMTERDAIYAKENFSEKDGMNASHLEGEFSELGGWTAESDAEKLLSDLGISDELKDVKMKNLEARQKVRVLLAQALFGNPDILLLDEPTNNLDVETSMWLEEFLCNFENTAIVVSHDRHFLDKVCTHIADIDYGGIKLYPGNFSFWKESTQLALRQRSETNKKIEEKRKELLEFIARFSANASKAKQATSRKKSLEKLVIDDIGTSSRRYPYIAFEQEKAAGNNILTVHGLSGSQGGEVMFKDMSFRVGKGDKIAFVGHKDIPKTALFRILAGESAPNAGSFKWGPSVECAYFPKDNSGYFDDEMNLVEWLSRYSVNKTENFLRGFLGRMLFSGEESLKSVSVLSGGEKVRCMLARMMLAQANVLILDEPANHLDLESISSLNEGLERFKGTLLFSSQDHQLVQSVANRIMEITPRGLIDRPGTTYDEYLADDKIKQRRHELYS
jgi:ATPase subunit of ABC transporter with duplicated ATPase domains